MEMVTQYFFSSPDEKSLIFQFSVFCVFLTLHFWSKFPLIVHLRFQIFPDMCKSHPEEPIKEGAQESSTPEEHRGWELIDSQAPEEHGGWVLRTLKLLRNTKTKTR